MLDTYIRKFSKLRGDRVHWASIEATKGVAPHKPLLLLAVIEQFRQGQITTNLIKLTSDLTESFSSYWQRIMPPGKSSTIALPFFHLKSEGFWHLQPVTGKEDILAAKRSMRSVTELQEITYGAQLDPALFGLLQDEDCRETLAATLLNIYFSEEARQALTEQGQINFEAFVYSQKLLERTANAEPTAQSEPVRTAGFRRAIVTAYDHRCAMSGLRILSPEGHTAVNAAHIIPWSESYNDDPSNGLALSPLCHWAFDKGLISLDRKFRIILSSYLRHDRNIAGELLALEKREIIFPDRTDLYPDPEAVEYHRKTIFYR